MTSGISTTIEAYDESTFLCDLNHSLRLLRSEKDGKPGMEPKELCLPGEDYRIQWYG